MRHFNSKWRKIDFLREKNNGGNIVHDRYDSVMICMTNLQGPRMAKGFSCTFYSFTLRY
jgi:hypothetical protein